VTTPRTFRFVDRLPPGATVLCWDGKLLVIWPQDASPPPPALRAVPVVGKVS
jgi:hypothetical protein